MQNTTSGRLEVFPMDKVFEGQVVFAAVPDDADLDAVRKSSISPDWKTRYRNVRRPPAPSRRLLRTKREKERETNKTK
eukprot:1182146-Prorocentrum_minimum.AAC.2